MVLSSVTRRRRERERREREIYIHIYKERGRLAESHENAGAKRVADALVVDPKPYPLCSKP